MSVQYLYEAEDFHCQINEPPKTRFTFLHYHMSYAYPFSCLHKDVKRMVNDTYLYEVVSCTTQKLEVFADVNENMLLMCDQTHPIYVKRSYSSMGCESETVEILKTEQLNCFTVFLQN